MLRFPTFRPRPQKGLPLCQHGMLVSGKRGVTTTENASGLRHPVKGEKLLPESHGLRYYILENQFRLVRHYEHQSGDVEIIGEVPGKVSPV